MAVVIKLVSDPVLTYGSSNAIVVSIEEDTAPGEPIPATVTMWLILAGSGDIYSQTTELYERYADGVPADFTLATSPVEFIPGLEGFYRLNMLPIHPAIQGLPGSRTEHLLVRVMADAGVAGTGQTYFGLRVVKPASMASIVTSGDPVYATTEITQTDLTTVGGVLRLLATAAFGNQIIDDSTKTLKLYNSTGTDVVLEFDLQDAAGLASVREPFRRIRT